MLNFTDLSFRNLILNAKFGKNITELNPVLDVSPDLNLVLIKGKSFIKAVSSWPNKALMYTQCYLVKSLRE